MVSALADLIALGAGLVAAGERAGLVPLWRATTAAIAARRRAPPRPRSRRASGPPRTRCGAGEGHGPLDALAAELPPTPGLEEALA